MAKKAKSVLKRIRQNAKRRLRNKAAISRMKTYIKKFLNALEEKSENLQEIFKTTIKIIDKTASKGIIHKNTAARKKSRLTKKLLKVSKEN